jgi:hypothetical protein
MRWLTLSLVRVAADQAALEWRGLDRKQRGRPGRLPHLELW